MKLPKLWGTYDDSALFRGRAVPIWLGHAYHHIDLRQSVFVLVPFNVLVSLWVNRIWPFVDSGGFESKLERAKWSEYSRGFNDGQKSGEKEGRRLERLELSQSLDEALIERVGQEAWEKAKQQEQWPIVRKVVPGE